MKSTFGAVVGLALLLTACGAGEWLEGIGWRKDESPIERVLLGAEGTPGSQGLLYVAMAEAEAASQAATRALARADDSAERQGQIGEVVYALAPAAAPDWRAKNRGIVPGWSGKGYGVLRAVDEMQVELQRLAAASPAPDERLDAVRLCVANTRARADLALRTALELLEDKPAREIEALLPQLERFAQALNRGLDADGDGRIALAQGECGLEQAKPILDEIRLRQSSRLARSPVAASASPAPG